VLAVVYLIFNEGYAASSGERLIREELATEAIRLGRLLAELMPDEPEALELIDGLPLAEYYLYHAIRADLLRRLGQPHEAAAAYQAAIDRTDNAAEIRFLKSRISEIRPRSTPNNQTS
jgi:predicted RNA polymerase sigma factor